MTRPLHEIAREIHADWGERVYFGARPYLDAMGDLSDVGESYGMDTGRSIVLYFLANATRWKGDVARRVKAELKVMVKQPPYPGVTLSRRDRGAPWE